MFSNFNYEINKESPKGKKEVKASWMFNGERIERVFTFPEVQGTAYVFKAKQQVDREMKSGALALYSEKYLERKYPDRKKVETKPTPITTTKVVNKTGVSGKVIAIMCIVFALIIAGAVTGTFLAMRGSAPDTVSISQSTSGCKINGPDTVKIGEAYQCTLSSDIKDAVIEVTEVQMAKRVLKTPEEYTFDNTNNTLVVNKVEGEIKITATAHEVVTSYPVEFYGIGCDLSNDSPKSVGVNKTYECNILPHKSSDMPYINKIIMNGIEILPSDYSFDGSHLKINKPADGPIKINAATNEIITSYPVDFSGYGCSVSPESPKVVNVGGQYECDITADRTTDVVVISNITMNGSPLTELDYSFDGSHLKITKSANGPVKISAASEQNIFSVDWDIPSDVKIDGEKTSKKGEKYSCTITSLSDKYSVNIKSVRMAGAILTSGTSVSGDYYYDSTNNRLVFNKQTDGNISIVVNTIVAKYEISYHLSLCELKDGYPTSIDAGAKLSCEFKEAGGTRKNLITGVTMGGIDLKEGTSSTTGDYYFTNDVLSLNVPASGDIVVSATSFDPGVDSYIAKFEYDDQCEKTLDIYNITPSDPIEANLRVKDPSTKKIHIDAVVMGGVSLKKDVDYTYDPTIPSGNNFKVLRVINNVLVKFEAVDIGDIVATPIYTLSEDKQSYVVNDFDLGGKQPSEIDSITIDATYAPANSNADPLPVTSIKAGSLNKFSNLKELSIPFIGGNKIGSGEDPRDGTQLFGYIFGDTPYAGASATWQNYYDELEISRLKKFIIPNSLRTVTIAGDDSIIPAGAFSGCRSLDEINFTQNKATVVKNCAFYGCVSLRNIGLPTTVATVESSTFQDCETLQHIDLPNDLTTIAPYAFSGCKSLMKVSLSKKIVVVGESAFTGLRAGVIACEKTKKEVLATSAWSKQWVDVGTSVVYGALSIADYIDSSDQFHYMLVRSEDDSSVTGAYIAEYVGNSRAEQITIPDTVSPKGSNGDETYPVLGLGDYMFSEYSLTKKFIFNCLHLTTIGSYCFSYCSTLETLENFNNLKNLKEIGPYCFGACFALSIEGVPNNVESIGMYAFAYDYQITNFDLTNTNIHSLEEGLFYYCCNLQSIASPTGLTYLGENIFEGCYALTSLTLNTKGIDTIPYALCYCADDPEHPERVSKLETFTWQSETPLTSIGGSAFGGCSSLTTVTFGSSTANHLPTSVGTVGDYAFTRCTSIKTFTIDKSNTGVSNINMGLEIFKNWTSSQTLAIASGWVTGGDWFSTEATLAWGWKLSRPMFSGNFHCSKTGSNDLVINKA